MPVKYIQAKKMEEKLNVYSSLIVILNFGTFFH